MDRIIWMTKAMGWNWAHMSKECLYLQDLSGIIGSTNNVGPAADSSVATSEPAPTSKPMSGDFRPVLAPVNSAPKPASRFLGVEDLEICDTFPANGEAIGSNGINADFSGLGEPDGKSTGILLCGMKWLEGGGKSGRNIGRSADAIFDSPRRTRSHVFCNPQRKGWDNHLWTKANRLRKNRICLWSIVFFGMGSMGVQRPTSMCTSELSTVIAVCIYFGRMQCALIYQFAWCRAEHDRHKSG